MNGNAMNINEEETLDSQMVKLIGDMKDYDRAPVNQNMRGQLINRLHALLPEFNNVEEIDAAHQGVLPKQEYFNLWKQDLSEYLDYQYGNNNNQAQQSIINEAYDILDNYMPNQNLHGGRRRRSRKTRKSRKSRKGRKGRSRRN